MKPSVSVVCIPVHKRTSYLRETVQKFLSQTFSNWELVIGLNVSEKVARLIHEDLREELNDPNLEEITRYALTQLDCLEITGGETPAATAQ